MKIAGKQRTRIFAATAAAALACGCAASSHAAANAPAAAPSPYTYADLADLADPAAMVVKAQIRKQVALDPEQSPGLRPGWVRLYVEARTLALLTGKSAIGESLKYLADVPLDARGKVPRLKNREVLLFAAPVAGRPDEIQLVDVDAQIPADPATEARLRSILTEMASPDAPPAIAGIRDALSVAGNLAGESETQLFLASKGGASVALSVIRRPGMAPEWGVSWTELVDQAARPPQRDTLGWYRLACFLPDSLPPEAILSRDGASRVRAAEDYRLILQELGPCPRSRSGGA